MAQHQPLPFRYVRYETGEECCFHRCAEAVRVGAVQLPKYGKFIARSFSVSVSPAM